ncbi:carbon-nitrogen hydrolase family protein [Labrys monachus]|uniref:Amidohydrolase n=1 Tax=Labrys monachus TaxID=217067 RepID=A0ABU0FIN1_9HYPH|nr:carbon-nitrogen hydrolase family protein [Labrys monachus]MDQ0394468.1 putative amidohydrolase [Labrys monachus]
MSKLVTLAVAQVPSVLGDVEANLEALTGYMADAAARGARLVVFPECFLSGYMFEDRESAWRSAIAADDAPMQRIAAECARLDIEIVVGFLERRGGRLHNSAALLGPQGIIGIHRKQHLPFLGGDRFVDEPEEAGLSLFDTRAGRLGIAICYEIRFPEVMRTLALEGADLVALPTNWPVQSVLLAEYFTRVRAAENFVYLLVANRADREGGAEFLGQSQIVDPSGTVLHNAGRDEGLTVASVDLDRARDKSIIIEAGRFELHPWKDRRPASYRL